MAATTSEPTGGRPSVFLSYARQDDDAFVERLFTALRAHGFPVWWDRESMPSRSLTFTEEIREAIHRSDRLIVVLGPRAARSEYVRAEWQSALAERKPVIPVLRRVPDEVADAYAWLPADLSQLHAPDLRASGDVEPSLEPLVRILGEPVPPPAPVLGGPPELPPHFRPRLDAFARLSEAVLGELTGPRVHTGQRRVTVLTGMGGIGKTALAAAMVEAVRSRPSTFLADGVFWLSGPPLRRLAALCAAAPADPLDDRSVEDAVADQLHGKRFLLVLDDATAVEQVAPLVRVLGTGGRMLVTTRNGELAVGHQRVDLDEMGDDDALALVADWLSVPLDAVPPAARRMVELCGRHPFAIAVNAAAARQGLPWSTILTALEQRELDFAEQRFEEYVYATVDESLRVSVDALPEDERERYRELAAFIWDPVVPASAVAGFWGRRGGLAGHRADRLLVHLRQRSLLQLRGDPEAYEVRLHDLQRAYLQSDDRRTRALAEALLASYRPDPPGAWWAVPDDGYLRQHLVRHLAAARPAGDLAALLCAEDARHHNRWFSARLERPPRAAGDADGFAGYVADVEVAAERLPGPLLPLVTASLRSLARAVPGGLLREAVRDDRWSLQRAMAQARLVPEPERRAAAMVALLSRVPDRASWLEETLDALRAADVAERGPLVRALAAAIDPSQALVALDRIVAWVQQAASPYERTHSVPLVWPVLERVPAEGAHDAVTLVASVGVTPLRLYGLLPEPERSVRIRHAVDARRAEPGGLGVALLADAVGEVAGYLAPQTARPLIDEALAAVRGLPPEETTVFRREGLLALLPVLAAGEREEVLDELIREAIEEPQLWARLASATPADLQGRVREALEGQHLAWIAKAAPAFAREHRRALVERALTEIEAHENAASLLWMDDSALLLAMDEQQLERARRVIDTQLSGEVRIRALAGVVRATPFKSREQAVDDALAAIDALPEADDRQRSYTAVAPYLTDRQVADALAAAQRIGEPSGREHLPKLLSHVSETVRARVLDAFVRWAAVAPIRRWQDGLRSLPGGLNGREAEPLLQVARAQAEATTVAHFLALLVQKVGEEERARVEDEATAAIERCGSLRVRLDCWMEMGAAGPAERELEQLAPTLQADDLAQYVADLARLVQADRIRPWVDQVLRSGGRGRYLLERVAGSLDPSQASTYLARNLNFQEFSLGRLKAVASDQPFVAVEEQGPAVGALARRLGELGAADEAWSLLSLGRDDEVTAMGLVELAPYLSAQRVLAIDQRVRGIRIGSLFVPERNSRVGVDRTYLTGRLAPALVRTGELDRALGYARATDADRWRVPALLGIAKVADGTTRTDIVLEAFAVVAGLRGVFRRDHLDDVARAAAADPAAATEVWPRAVDWARRRARHEAVEMVLSLAPVAAVTGGGRPADEVAEAIERVLRWWP